MPHGSSRKSQPLLTVDGILVFDTGTYHDCKNLTRGRQPTCQGCRYQFLLDRRPKRRKGIPPIIERLTLSLWAYNPLLRQEHREYTATSALLRRIRLRIGFHRELARDERVVLDMDSTEITPRCPLQAVVPGLRKTGAQRLQRPFRVHLLSPPCCSSGRPSHKPVVWYKGFLYLAASWKTARRVVVAKVEFHFGELFPESDSS